MAEQENRQLIEQYIQGINDQDIDALTKLLADDIIEEYPQSGERINGKKNWTKVYENFQDMPSLKAYNLHFSGDLCVLEMHLEYPKAGTRVANEIIDFENGKIKRIRGYFAEPFEAPDWRSQYVERAPSFEETPAPRG